MIVKTREAAWKEADKLFPTDYEKDLDSTRRAGYPIYRSTTEGHFYFYICDLGDRLEVNMNDETVNIWIKPEPSADAGSCRRMVHYREKDGNSQHQLQLLAFDILKYGKITNECHHVSQEFFPDGTDRTVETGSYTVAVLNEITGIRYWVHFSGCRITEILEERRETAEAAAPEEGGENTESPIDPDAQRNSSLTGLRRFELLTKSEAEKNRLEMVLNEKNLSRQDLAVILFGLRVRSGFGKKDFGI